MNHQRFKFYKHSTEYYKSLYNTIKELEELDVTPCITQYPSTINYNRKSKFIKSNSNTNKMHKKVMWDRCESYEIHNLLSQSDSCDLLDLCGILQISC